MAKNILRGSYLSALKRLLIGGKSRYVLVVFT